MNSPWMSFENPIFDFQIIFYCFLRDMQAFDATENANDSEIVDPTAETIAYDSVFIENFRTITANLTEMDDPSKPGRIVY